MDYYVIPEFMYIFFLFCAAAVIVSAICGIVDQIRLHIRKKQKEKEFFADRVEYSPEELAKMKERFPGKYSAEELLMFESACISMLDGALVAETEYLNEIYDRAKIGLTEEQENRIVERLTEARGAEGFISFMRDHGINAYFTYLQNGEIFFEDKPECIEGGDAG